MIIWLRLEKPEDWNVVVSSQQEKNHCRSAGPSTLVAVVKYIRTFCYCWFFLEINEAVDFQFYQSEWAKYYSESHFTILSLSLRTARRKSDMRELLYACTTHPLTIREVPLLGAVSIHRRGHATRVVEYARFLRTWSLISGDGKKASISAWLQAELTFMSLNRLSDLAWLSEW